MTFSLSRWLWRRRDSKAGPHALRRKQKEKEEEEGVMVIGSGRRKNGVGRSKSRVGQVDPEFGGVMVPVNGVCMTDSDSGESDWSIGWFEPQSSEFSTEDESEKSFAFLVPCYSLPAPPEKKIKEEKNPSGGEPKTQLSDAVLSNSPTQDSQKYVQQWLDSLKNQ